MNGVRALRYEDVRPRCTDEERMPPKQLVVMLRNFSEQPATVAITVNDLASRLRAYNDG